MKAFILIIIILSLFEAKTGEEHAIYISVSSINIDPAKNELTATIRIFTDDLEDAIHNFSGERKKIIDRLDFADVQSFIEDYLNNKISIIIGKELVPIKVRRIENVGDTTWIYLRSDINTVKGSLTITNSLLLEIFDSQRNIVEIDIDGSTFYFNLDKKQTQATVSL